MSHPGDHKTQSVSVKADYRSIPDECDGMFLRVPKIRFQIQDPLNHQRWFSAGPFVSPVKNSETVEKELDEIEKELEERGESCWKETPRGKSYICRTDNQINNKGGIVEAGVRFPVFIPARERYRCTPGKGVTHVRALLLNRVRNTSIHRIVGQRSTYLPVRVKRVKYVTERQRHRGGLPGPC